MHLVGSTRGWVLGGVVAALCWSALVGAPPAGAQQDYPPRPGVVFSDPSPGPGDTVLISGPGRPGAPVVIMVCGSPLATTTVGDDGTFSIEVTIPAAMPASCLLEVYVDGELVSSSTIQVVAQAPPPAVRPLSAGALASTGSPTDVVVQVGIGLTTLGAMLALAARRRRRLLPAP